MHPGRIKKIIDTFPLVRKKYILYWMQQSQRVHYNHALNHAIELANQLQLPVLVFFGIDDSFPEANLRHFQFMLEGIYEIKNLLSQLGITFVMELGNPIEKIKTYLADASLLVCDMGYTRLQRKWRQELYKLTYREYRLNIDQVESDLIVPIQKASEKCEYGAYTLRPKIMKQYQHYRDFHKLTVVKNQEIIVCPNQFAKVTLVELLNQLSLDRSVGPSTIYHGGYQEASNHFIKFLLDFANDYPNSSDPSKNQTSKMSMYLHFGQISALELLERITLAFDMGQVSKEAYDAFVEQLLVRRELAFNYIYYNDQYDQFDGMTEPWAYQTMREHLRDERQYIYTLHELEHALTHDIYFNAAMEEMSHTGFMQNYMRMYWAKKIIEWSLTYEEAYERIQYLNNKYFIDGRDANSFAGVAWCFGKHDRAWSERPIFGKLRYMNEAGLVRKFDMENYIKLVTNFKQVS
ncbi:MAG TPA: deoxyribodipyrimidine photo-lyase [Bacilli bacterium]|nr:deoxyribodipyrimidine photo-lyase [Bacilli bacterium]